MYSEKATNFCEISTVDLTVDKSAVENLQTFVAFSEYMNFIEVNNIAFHKLKVILLFCLKIM